MNDAQYYMHVNYLENAALTFEQMFPLCAEAGYDGIELRDRDRSGQIPLNEYLPRVYEGATAAGLAVTFGCRNNTTSPDPAVREQEFENFRTVIEFAGQRGIRVLNTFAGPSQSNQARRGHMEEIGSNVATEDQWNWSVEYFKAAAKVAAEHDIVLALETHGGYIHDLAKPAVAFLDRIGHENVQLNFDFGNIYLHPDNHGLEAELDLMRGRIGYVHLKNMRSLRQFNVAAFFATPLRDGDINNFVLLRKLLGDGYRGILAIENTMPGDKRHLMREDLDYLKSLKQDADSLIQTEASA